MRIYSLEVLTNGNAEDRLRTTRDVEGTGVDVCDSIDTCLMGSRRDIVVSLKTQIRVSDRDTPIVNQNQSCVG